MRTIVLIALLISLASAQYTLNLEQVTIPHTTPVNQVYDEDLYYVQIAFNKENANLKAVLDTHEFRSWRTVPTSAGNPAKSFSTGYKDQIVSTTAAEVNNEVQLPKDKKIKDVKFYEGAVTTASNAEYTKAGRLGAGLALGGYFAKEAPVTFKVNQPLNTNGVYEGVWKIQLTNFGIDQIVNEVNSAAVFDTTTEFIWVKDVQYDWIKNTLTNQYGLVFTNGDECTCTPAKNPQVYLQFSNGASTPANENTKAKFYLTAEDFLKPSKTADRCNLVFRQLVNSADPDVVLGTAFLKGVYTWFVDPVEGDNDDGTKKVKMATSFKVPLQNLKFDVNWRIALTTVGCFIIVCAVAILLSILQKVPYEAEEFVKLQTYNPRPVVVNQSPIQQKPLVYSQSPVQYIQQSPQRVVYRNQY